MLHVRTIDTFYGTSQTLFGVSLTVADGEVVTLLGRNGMGKSTTIKSIIGLTPPRHGAIFFAGRAIEKAESHVIARMGIGLVPEGRQIFPNLTVHENLVATAANPRRIDRPYALDDIFALFPRLAERRRHFGNQLSGGEQQMLAIGRALMINPRLLLLDEATEGLAPLVRREIWRALAILKDKGLAILVIDKNLDALLAIARRHYIMEKGRIVWTGTTADLRPDRDLQARYIGV
ncbi:MAG: ABC transporter ATP-binding protein [Desulfoprunum sp.]|jgi:branched-chain amino acid transport system ATP-binding protein|uniref:ABC transporter ATP-binding protein n=1 Tax=Desulfoprunum sp. TaxID=2020866 RepID=UPI00052D3A30|nr:ABC transporter ATP-binding protein [Desulfobulbus sp. Tol-SR]